MMVLVELFFFFFLSLLKLFDSFCSHAHTSLSLWTHSTCDNIKFLNSKNNRNKRRGRWKRYVGSAFFFLSDSTIFSCFSRSAVHGIKNCCRWIGNEKCSFDIHMIIFLFVLFLHSFVFTLAAILLARSHSLAWLGPFFLPFIVISCVNIFCFPFFFIVPKIILFLSSSIYTCVCVLSLSHLPCAFDLFQKGFSYCACWSFVKGRNWMFLSYYIAVLRSASRTISFAFPSSSSSFEQSKQYSLTHIHIHNLYSARATA